MCEQLNEKKLLGAALAPAVRVTFKFEDESYFSGPEEWGIPVAQVPGPRYPQQSGNAESELLPDESRGTLGILMRRDGTHLGMGRCVRRRGSHMD